MVGKQAGRQADNPKHHRPSPQLLSPFNLHNPAGVNPSSDNPRVEGEGWPLGICMYGKAVSGSTWPLSLQPPQTTRVYGAPYTHTQDGRRSSPSSSFPFPLACCPSAPHAPPLPLRPFHSLLINFGFFGRVWGLGFSC